MVPAPELTELLRAWMCSLHLYMLNLNRESKLLVENYQAIFKVQFYSLPAVLPMICIELPSAVMLGP